jgi:hypothetical protein
MRRSVRLLILSSRDSTAPTLSSATDASSGTTTGALGVTTNEANGTLYWYVSTSATPPSAANLKSGSGSTTSGSQAVATTGVQNSSPTGLAANTAYYAHFLQRDNAGNDSAIVSGDGFTTDYAFTNTEASDLVARMTTPPSSTRKGLIDTLFTTLKSIGLTKFDALYLFAASDSA